jgi:hypothetical protein
MAIPRSLCALAGAMTAFGGVLWLSAMTPLAVVVAISWEAVTIVHALAMVATAAVALLVTTAGTLLAADWRVDVQSREAWAQNSIAAAELSLPALHVTRDDLDPRYLRPTDEDALRRVFQVHRFAPRAPVPDSTERASPSIAVASQVDLTAQAVRTARAPARAKPPAAIGPQAPVRRKAAGARHVGARVRLVVNANPWRSWPGAECILSRTTPQRHTADIVVLGSSRDEQSRPSPEAPAFSDTAGSTEPPSCRGPPQGGRRSSAVGTAPATQLLERAPGMPGAGKRLAAAPIVRDDLGEQVPICAAELDVIETYLDHVLRDLLASSTVGSGQEQT